MGAKETPDVRVGDVWADNDTRVRYVRRVRVVRVEQGPEARAHCVVVDGGRRVQILVSRFRPTSTGYRLVEREDVRVGDVWQRGHDRMRVAEHVPGGVIFTDSRVLFMSLRELRLMGRLVERDGKPVEA